MKWQYNRIIVLICILSQKVLRSVGWMSEIYDVVSLECQSSISESSLSRGQIWNTTNQRMDPKKKPSLWYSIDSSLCQWLIRLCDKKWMKENLNACFIIQDNQHYSKWCHSYHASFWITNSIFDLSSILFVSGPSFIISLLQYKLFANEGNDWWKKCSKVALKMHSKHSSESRSCFPVEIIQTKSFMIRFIFCFHSFSFVHSVRLAIRFSFFIHSYSFVLCISVCALIVSNSVDIIFSTSCQSA